MCFHATTAIEDILVVGACNETMGKTFISVFFFPYCLTFPLITQKQSYCPEKLLEQNLKMKEIIYNIIIFHFQVKTLDLKEKQRRKQRGIEQSVHSLFKRRESAKCQL